ncbi:hypothetical protein [Stackebrandtia nassauensis]|uniref:Uncharacterized protein n=1 Tax=Stackebrandtia nassauensis (strain DSM 44728 / CIP 108903 / NRRL B-16338 / NBRC 102104 / LLR-40K-21) TaxID=446470 RepID=D3Q221_STANL|nr:hypothetical protein [Stackebrandtia nassauensis]ADD41888.1 hypothetical protein Snas_2197 [Stackebrandtia nassauensis DSM 44728]
MTDNQQHYPDSSGARWETPAERPAFLDRTEPVSRQEREVRGGDSSLDDLMGNRNRTSRLPSQERGEEPSGVHAVPRGPESPPQQWSHDNAPAPAPQWSPENAPASPPQWSPDSAPTPPPQLGEPATGDPELAAVSRMDAPRQVPPPMPPQLGDNAHRPPMAQPSPPPADLNEPTQMHNPVTSAPPAQQQRGSTYPPQSGGVYQSNKSGLGSLAWVAALIMALPIAYVMIRSLASGADVILSGAVASGVFALAGLPLTAYGLQASLNANTGETPSPLRAPYVYLVIGLVLLLAAGMAAG